MMTFTAILLFVCVFLVWLLYLSLRDKNQLKKENEEIVKSKKRLQKTYETKTKEQEENEELKKKMHSDSADSFNASLDLLQKYSNKNK